MITVCTIAQRFFLTIPPVFDLDLRSDNLPDGCNDVLSRPDLTSRVFALKLKELEKDILGTSSTPGIFGKVVAYVRVIEFQKRNLPHAHMIVTLEQDLETESDVDHFISAELPSPPRVEDYDTEQHYVYAQNEYKRLMSIVSTKHVHGNCQGDVAPIS